MFIQLSLIKVRMIFLVNPCLVFPMFFHFISYHYSLFLISMEIGLLIHELLIINFCKGPLDMSLTRLKNDGTTSALRLLLIFHPCFALILRQCLKKILIIIIIIYSAG